MCIPENAIKNMEFIGYVSVIATPEVLEWADDAEIEETADLRYFFGEGAEAVHANQVFYPDQSVIDRCALMHDCGAETKEMLDMWSRVKGDNLSKSMVMIIVLVVLAIVIFAVIQTMNKRKQMAQQRKRKQRR
jgi:spermidine/putrescine transport system substrate-binding protein